ncbi:MAG: ADP-ribosylglycohydrolase family protein [Armatimonadetes bacterium]|nr:ADP-ribosylglycohydrolase family protein [Armatimonadota bacterium]
MDEPDRLAGVILGTAVGDAIGLPREGLPPGRARAWFGVPPLRHRLWLGRGWCSDDTEHILLVAQAFLRSPGDAEGFGRALAWGLRGWFLTFPAGIGKATARACLRLLCGCGPGRSGVWSAGNGPAMRAAVLGVLLADRTDELRPFVEVCSRITHTDPRAVDGALLIALAARAGVADTALVLPELERATADPELLAALAAVRAHLAAGASPAEFAVDIGQSAGIRGYVVPTVAVALFCWLRYPDDFRQAVEEVVLLGGDADTTGAITGALAGATLGASAIPEEWLAGLAEWPRTVAWMRRLAERLQRQLEQPDAPVGPEPWPWLLVLPRNALFLAVVLAHGFRRLLPPWR